MRYFSQAATVEQRMSEKAVRLLLHRARKPNQLARFPLAAALCGILALSDPAAALRKVVDAAFPGERGDDAALRSLVVRCDLEGSVTLEQACKEFGYSRRHFQRFRAKAIAAIAHYIRRVLDPSFADGLVVAPLEALADVIADRDPAAAARIYRLVRDPVPPRGALAQLRARVRSGENLSESDLKDFAPISEPLALALTAQSKELAGNRADVMELLSRLHFSAARSGIALDTVTCYELEWLHFLQAKHRSDIHALRSSTNALKRLATDRPNLRARTLCASAAAAIHHGDRHSAAEALGMCAFIAHQERNADRLAASALLQSNIELLKGDAIAAEDLAQGALIAFDRTSVSAFDCHHAIARARLLAQRAWSLPDVSARPRQSWHNIALHLAFARHRLATGDTQSAAHLALAGRLLAEQMHYVGLCANAAGTLALCASIEKDKAAAKVWSTLAFGDFAKTLDHLVGFDLFALPSNPATETDSRPVSDQIVSALQERVQIAIPQMMGDTNESMTHVQGLLGAFLDYALSASELASLDAAIFRNTNSALSRHFSRSASTFEDEFALMLSVLVPFGQRDRVRDRVGTAVRYLEANIRPSEKKVYAAG